MLHEMLMSADNWQNPTNGGSRVMLGRQGVAQTILYAESPHKSLPL
jgi:hypothetical protein